MKARLPSILLLALVATVHAPAANHNAYPLPEERGTPGILGALEKLPVYAHVLYTIAHPDDESPGTLVWLSRREHVRTALFSLTRGEGGQNILGSEKYEAMGLLRTGELLEACRLYGVEPYFSTAFEFGFSKSAEETLAKWDKQRTLEELVRFIRIWRPAIIISQFSGTAADGHGHHQVAGLLTREAFRAAGDPAAFPEHMNQGLSPWHTKLLYMRGGREGSRAVAVGSYDPVLGRSFIEIGIEGYSKHRSQGNGARFVLPGPASDYFTLVDSTLSEPDRQPGLLGPIDTSLPSITDLIGDEAARAAPLRPLLQAAQESGREAIRLFQPDHPERAAPAVAAGLDALSRAQAALSNLSLTPAGRLCLRSVLDEKIRDFQEALDATLGIYLSALADNPAPVPGEAVGINGRIVNRGAEDVALQGVTVRAPAGWAIREKTTAGNGKTVPSGESIEFAWIAGIPATAAITEPFWYRAHPADMHYTIRPTRNAFAPFEEPLISLETSYFYRGTKVTSTKPVLVQTSDPIRGVDFVDLQILPAVSVMLSPDPVILTLASTPQTRDVLVTVRNERATAATGKVRLKLPADWTSQPPEAEFNIAREGEESYARFAVRVPGQKRSKQAVLEAEALVQQETYTRGYRQVSYPENWTRYLYAPARAEVRIFNYSVQQGLRVGYVPGAGDEVAEALEQLGARVRVLSEEDIQFGNLADYAAIVTGIRAYNVNQPLRTNNLRLLRYVKDGGTLIVQYCRPEGGQAFAYAPYPFVISNADRITVEESPVTILAPAHPLFTRPNRITSADFDGWVQERGLYFAREWDARYTPLLSGADPGEPQLRGGMLVAKYGKGYYIYTAYAWFRQLPAGVAGAYRIFANMLSLGGPP
jgi:LmbE family N-acetylglucosaminyl deacetylase